MISRVFKFLTHARTLTLVQNARRQEHKIVLTDDLIEAEIARVAKAVRETLKDIQAENPEMDIRLDNFACVLIMEGRTEDTEQEQTYISAESKRRYVVSGILDQGVREFNLEQEQEYYGISVEEQDEDDGQSS